MSIDPIESKISDYEDFNPTENGVMRQIMHELNLGTT